MPEPTLHDAAFHRLCERALARLGEVKTAPPAARGERVREAIEALREIDREVAEHDVGSERFAEEQGDLVAAASALQAVALDRGGAHVERCVDRAIAAIRHVASL